MATRPKHPQALDDVRVTLRLHPDVVLAIDDLNAYLPQGTRVDMVRYLMNKGMEHLRFQQTVREQADVIERFAGMVSEEFSEMTRVVQKMDTEQRVMAFPAPVESAQDLDRKDREKRKRKRSGS